MKTDRAIALVLVGVGAAYLVWRIQAAKGGQVVLINPFLSLQPGNPSPVGTAGDGDTNPISNAFAMITGIFKAPGNANPSPAAPIAPGTSTDPVGPPVVGTLTAQPEQSTLLIDLAYVPNLGDPNFSAWNYIASTPPDLSWNLYLNTGGSYVA